MIQPIMHDPLFLAQKSAPATPRMPLLPGTYWRP